MSDYCHSRVVRLKATEEQLGVKSIWDMEDKYPELFGNSDVNKFEIAPTEEPFVDYVLYYTYGEESDDWGRTRTLSDKELDKYLPIFRQIYPEVKSENLRYVDYCFYNCSEAPDYFDDGDDFYDEI